MVLDERGQLLTSAQLAEQLAKASERGIALILALIFSILLYILVAELVVSGRMLRHTGENDALVSRMQNQMEYTMAEVSETLLGDLASVVLASQRVVPRAALESGYSFRYPELAGALSSLVGRPDVARQEALT